MALGTHSAGGGLVRAHTTDRRRFFPCQPCPVPQRPSAWEIPRERRAEVGLRPLNLHRECGQNALKMCQKKKKRCSVVALERAHRPRPTQKGDLPSSSFAFPFSWAHCFGPPVFVLYGNLTHFLINVSSHLGSTRFKRFKFKAVYSVNG